MPHPKVYNLTDHWFPDKMGGSCIYAYKLHRLLSERVDIETVTLLGEKTPCEEGMVVHKVLHKSRFVKNRRIIRGLCADSDAIWVVHSPWFFFHLFIALGFRVRKSVVAVYHGPWFREYFHCASAHRNIVVRVLLSLLRYLVELFYCVCVRRFIFLSENMFRLTSEYLPISQSQVHIIPMWSARSTWDDPRQSNDELVISTFRRLEPRMGLQDMILALNRFDIEKYTLNICGDGPYKDELIRLIQQHKLQAAVKLLGWVTEEDKDKLIRESDAVIIPSRCLEGFSLLALEALENGTPVLLTEAVGFYEYVRGLDQDVVKKICFDDQNVEVREFLLKGSHRHGMDDIKRRFEADRIGQELLAVLLRIGD
jgi:glycosyltransferase involved in cell wall biosynthesis